MAVTFTGRGSGTNNAGANPLNVSPSGNFAAGSWGVLCVTADNASSGGATNDLAATITDSLGNVWTRRTAPLFDNGAASAGIQGAIYTSPCAAGAPQTTTTIGISSGVAATAKGWSLYEVVPSAGKLLHFANGGVNTGATTGTPTVTTDTAQVGDGVVGCYHAEGVAATTQDSDATNGSWDTQVTVTVGSTTSGIRHSSQTKVQTTTASTQTFNPTATSQDCILSWIRLEELTPVVATVGKLALTIAAFAPTVTAHDNKTATPAKLSLTTTGLAPTVTRTQNQRATPSTLALVLTRLAPSVLTPRTATPGRLSLALTALAPSVATPRRATPAVAALALTAAAPVVRTPRLVTPAVAALTLTRFAPAVATPRRSTPGTASLALASFAPTIGRGATAVPGKAALVTAGQAPTVSISDHKRAVPGVAGLALAPAAPTVTASDHQRVAPSTAALAMTAFAPTVVASDQRRVVPGTAALAMTAFAPDAVVGDASRSPSPAPAALLLTGYAPIVTAGQVVMVVPGRLALVLTTYPPRIGDLDLSQSSIAIGGIGYDHPAVAIDAGAAGLVLVPAPVSIEVTPE